jgi:hypothetical protein
LKEQQKAQEARELRARQVKARNKLLELAFDGEHDEVAQLLTAAVDLPSVDVCDENGSTALSEARRTLTILVIVQSNTMIRE